MKKLIYRVTILIFVITSIILLILFSNSNEPKLKDPNELSEVLKETNLNIPNDIEALRESKEASDQKYISTLTSIIDSKETHKEEREIAIKSKEKKENIIKLEMEVETKAIQKGYENALCLIDNNRVTLLIIANKTLSDKDITSLKDVISNITKLSDIIIEQKNN